MPGEFEFIEWVRSQAKSHPRLKTIAPGDPVCVEPTGQKVSPFYRITDRAICNYYRRYWSLTNDEKASVAITTVTPRSHA
jgi:hypothetical protein